MMIPVCRQTALQPLLFLLFFFSFSLVDQLGEAVGEGDVGGNFILWYYPVWKVKKRNN